MESNDRIAVLMPTRGDPELFAHAVSTMESTQSGNADLFFYVADDDPRIAPDFKRRGPVDLLGHVAAH